MTLKKTIIITSVGSLLGQNLLDTLDADQSDLRIIGTNSLAEAAGNFRCDRTYLVPLAADEQRYMARLKEIIEIEKPDLVIPGRDDDIIILSRLREQMSSFKENILSGPETFANVMDDKVKSHAFGLRHGLPFAPTVSSSEADVAAKVKALLDDFGFPLIAKPSKGNGSRGIWIVLDQTQLDNVLTLSDYAIQPLFGQDKLELDTAFGLPFMWEVPEKELHAVQVLISKEGKIGTSFGFTSEMVHGKCERLDPNDDAELSHIAHRFAEAAAEEGWRGTFNIQFKKDPRHGYQAIEMNGRFSGGTSARYHLGFDEVAWIINDWLGEEVLKSRPVPDDVKYIVRSHQDFLIRDKDLTTLQEAKVWDRASTSEA